MNSRDRRPRHLSVLPVNGVSILERGRQSSYDGYGRARRLTDPTDESLSPIFNLVIGMEAIDVLLDDSIWILSADHHCQCDIASGAERRVKDKLHVREARLK